MPHSDPHALRFERSNGQLTVRITALGEGLPYGSLSRLLLAWVTTEAVRTRSPELVLGHTLAAFMRQLDLTPTGGRWGTIPRLRRQMVRLFTSAVSVSQTAAERDRGRALTRRRRTSPRPSTPAMPSGWSAGCRSLPRPPATCPTRPLRGGSPTCSATGCGSLRTGVRWSRRPLAAGQAGRTGHRRPGSPSAPAGRRRQPARDAHSSRLRVQGSVSPGKDVVGRPLCRRSHRRGQRAAVPGDGCWRKPPPPDEHDGAVLRAGRAWDGRAPRGRVEQQRSATSDDGSATRLVHGWASGSRAR
jgi:replication initiator protein